MKHRIILLSAILLTGCIRKGSIDFTGTIPGVQSGVFLVKTSRDSAVFGENIKNGKFSIAKKQLKYPDYYKITITDDKNPDHKGVFEVYLEGGAYAIETEAGKLDNYPKITSSSKTQQQLSAFYTLSDKLSKGTEEEIKTLNAELQKSKSLSQPAYIALLNKLSATQNKLITNNITAFKEFVKEYPNSEISGHILSEINYEDDPVSFYAIYKTLSPAAQNSDEGKEVGQKLSHLVQLVAGAKAPEIAGNTADNKPFDKNSIKAKFILIDFWRAGNDFSRQNHEKLIAMLGSLKDKNSLAVISVSMDTNRDYWLDGIQNDHLTWTQVSDLKGDDSPNTVNWSIVRIPTYYLLDKDWKIVEANIPITNLELTIDEHFRKKVNL